MLILPPNPSVKTIIRYRMHGRFRYSSSQVQCSIGWSQEVNGREEGDRQRDMSSYSGPMEPVLNQL